MNFILRLEGIPGQTILECAVDAQRISTMLNVMVMFNFNGRTIMVTPWSDPQEIAEKFLASCQS